MGGPVRATMATLGPSTLFGGAKFTRLDSPATSPEPSNRGDSTQNLRPNFSSDEQESVVDSAMSLTVDSIGENADLAQQNIPQHSEKRYTICRMPSIYETPERSPDQKDRIDSLD